MTAQILRLPIKNPIFLERLNTLSRATEFYTKFFDVIEITGENASLDIYGTEVSFPLDHINIRGGVPTSTAVKSPPKKVFTKGFNTPVRFYAPHSILSFGKYKGSVHAEIIDLDIEYLLWCLTDFAGYGVTKESAEMICKEANIKMSKIPNNKLEGGHE